LPVNSVGYKIIIHCRNYNKRYEITAGLIKKVQRKEAKNIPAYRKIISEGIIQANKKRKETYKKTIVKKQRILGVIYKLL